MRFTLPLIALTAIAAPAVAAAQANEEAVTVRIAVADIDLATSEGQTKLEQRVNAELRQACTIEGASRYTYGRPVIDQKCFDDARAAALAEAQRIASNRARAGRQAAAN